MKLKDQIKNNLDNNCYTLEDYLDMIDGNKNTIPNLINGVDFLDEKISLIRRQLSAWDLYNIVETAESEVDFNSKWAIIHPNSSIIIKKSFSSGESTYSKGDILIKDENGSMIHIEAENQGIYYPSQILQESGTNNFTIVYKFSTTIPTGTSEDTLLINGDQKTNPSSTMKIQVQGASADNAVDLTYKEELSPINGVVDFDAIYYNNKVIVPVIKTYTNIDSSTQEPIEVELNIELNNKRFTIRNIPSIVSKVVVR